MEEKQVKVAKRRGSIIAKLGIGCVVCLFLCFAILLYAQEKTKSEFIGTKLEMDTRKVKETKETNAAKMLAMAKVKEQAEPQRNRAWGRQNRGDSVEFEENEAFYKSIVDHDLFRPLGWSPPDNESSYSLVGTAVDPNGVISQATLLEKRSNRYHFVTIGTKVGDMTVKDIEAKRVIFDKSGETVTLRTGEFQPLTTEGEHGDDRGGDRGEGGSEKEGDNNDRENRDDRAAEKRWQKEQNKRSSSERAQERRDIMEKLRHASSDAERREIMKYYKKEFGGSKGGDRGK